VRAGDVADRPQQRPTGDGQLDPVARHVDQGHVGRPDHRITREAHQGDGGHQHRKVRADREQQQSGGVSECTAGGDEAPAVAVRQHSEHSADQADARVEPQEHGAPGVAQVEVAA
jgi:hypothetical protein